MNETTYIETATVELTIIGTTPEAPAEVLASITDADGALGVTSPRSGMYRTWLRRIAAGEATTGQIRQFAQVGNGGGKATNLQPEEWREIERLLRATPIGLPDRDRDAGCTWLRRNGAKRLGLDPAVIDSVVDFRFDGEVAAYSNRVAVPVWIGVDAAGAHVLRYYAVSWQGVAYPGDGGPYIDAERVWLPRTVA